MRSAIGIIFWYQRFQFGELWSFSLLFPPTKSTSDLCLSKINKIRIFFGTRSSFIFWKRDPLMCSTAGRLVFGPLDSRCLSQASTWNFSRFDRNSYQSMNSGLYMTFRSEICASLMLTCLKQSPKRDQREWVRASVIAERFLGQFINLLCIS